MVAGSTRRSYYNGLIDVPGMDSMDVWTPHLAGAKYFRTLEDAAASALLVGGKVVRAQ
jgi:hypothetical protein